MTGVPENIDDVIDEVRLKVENDAYNFEKCATRLDRMGPYHLEDVVAAIFKSKGTLGMAARLLGRQRMRLRDWIYRNPPVLEFFEDYFEGTLDVIERNYIAEALAGDMQVSRHILSTKGRNRGYGAQPSGISVDPSALPFDGFTLTVVKAESPFDKPEAE